LAESPKNTAGGILYPSAKICPDNDGVSPGKKMKDPSAGRFFRVSAWFRRVDVADTALGGNDMPQVIMKKMAISHYLGAGRKGA
jgi:hypothetical protein